VEDFFTGKIPFLIIFFYLGFGVASEGSGGVDFISIRDRGERG
jgi:hypothetical protein